MEQAVSQADPFWDCLQRVEKDSRRMREALLERKPEVIWEAIQSQEMSLRDLQGLQQAGMLPKDLDVHQPVRETVERVRQILRTNRKMAAVFLGVIDRTLTHISMTKNPQPMTYSAKGKLGMVSGPCLIQQKG
jgi:hypothetical protein